MRRGSSTGLGCANALTHPAASSTTCTETTGQRVAAFTSRGSCPKGERGSAGRGDRLERNPVFLGPAAAHLQAHGLERGHDIAFAILEDARGKDPAARNHFVA